MRILLASPYKGSGGITRWTENIMDFYWDRHPVDMDLDLLPDKSVSLSALYFVAVEFHCPKKDAAWYPR